MKEDEKIPFLRDCMPFSSLSESELGQIAATMAWKEFPSDEIVIRQGVRGTHFFLIGSGLVKVFLLGEDSRETVLAFLGEGDCFGEISLLSNGPTTAAIRAMEDTVCLVQAREDFLLTVRKYPAFFQFFNQLLTNRMRSVYKELLSENPGVCQVEPYLYRKQVGDMLSRGEPVARESATIRETARKIIEEGLGAVVVVDEDRRPQGVVRLRGVVKTTLMEGVDPEARVSTIMERDFCSIDAESYFFDALHAMIRERVHELVVLRDGVVEGIVTGFDLLRFRGREVLSLIRNIDTAPDYDHLRRMRSEVEKVLRALMTDGALASQACKIVSEFNDRMVKRVLHLVEQECGGPPAPYAWLGLGSEGRREQTLLTDQDNAIIFAGNGKGGVRDYFSAFSSKVVEGLSRCGIPLCRGQVMATNPRYFGDLEEWKAKVTRWVTKPEGEGDAVLDNYVFLDFRAVYGDRLLEKKLKAHLIDLAKQHPSFLRYLALTAVSIPIPVGFFKNFIVERDGEHKNKLNLKLYGLVPLITCLKILALHEGIPETNTLERLKALGKKAILTIDQLEMLEQAYETFLTLKVRANLADLDAGRELSNHIDPALLSTRQKQLLKEAFWAVSQLQKTTKALLRTEDSDFGVIR